MFVSRQRKDYRWSEASPCIDAGTGGLVPESLLRSLPRELLDLLSRDLLGNARPRARRASLPARYDMGAYEFSWSEGK